MTNETMVNNRYGDGTTCICGNMPHIAGFVPVDPKSGNLVDYDESGQWDGKSYICVECGRVTDLDTLRVNPDATDKQREEDEAHITDVVGHFRPPTDEEVNSHM